MANVTKMTVIRAIQSLHAAGHRLADLVPPPPRKHRHRYHGVFAPNHKLRRAVTALAIGNVGKRREAVDPGPIRKILTHLGEPLEPPPVSPARGPPIDWGEFVQVHDDRAIFQGRTDELAVIDIQSL